MNEYGAYSQSEGPFQIVLVVGKFNFVADPPEVWRGFPRAKRLGAHSKLFFFPFLIVCWRHILFLPSIDSQGEPIANDAIDFGFLRPIQYSL